MNFWRLPSTERASSSYFGPIMASVVQGGSILPSSYTNATDNIPQAVTGQLESFVSNYVAELGFWKIALTILLALAVYDQCKRLDDNTLCFHSRLTLQQVATSYRKARLLAHPSRCPSWGRSYRPSIRSGKATYNNGPVAP